MSPSLRLWRADARLPVHEPLLALLARVERSHLSRLLFQVSEDVSHLVEGRCASEEDAQFEATEVLSPDPAARIAEPEAELTARDVELTARDARLTEVEAISRASSFVCRWGRMPTRCDKF